MRGFKGSLALRILLIETLLIFIPLILFTVLLYIVESHLRTKDNRFTLDLVLKSKNELIQEMIMGEESFLNLLHQTKPSLESMTEIKTFHLIRKGKSYICDQASFPEIMDKNFTFIPMPLKEGVLVGEGKQFYFLAPFSEGEEVWGTAFSENQLTDKLHIKKNIPYKTVVSLLGENGTVLLSTDQKWDQKQIFFKKNALSFEGERYIGESLQVGRSNLKLLIAAPKKASLVPVPYFFAKLVPLLLLILIGGGGITLWLTTRLSKPLHHLSNVMHAIGKGNLKARYKKDKFGFEINIIGGTLNETAVSLIEVIDKMNKEKVAKETLEKELLIGQSVQRSILPKELPAFPGLDIAARFVAAKEVGGDFYDFFIHEKEQSRRLFFSIADTAGKGIYACLYSLTVRSMLRSYGEMHHDLGKIIRETNNLFCLDTGDSGVFVTAWVAFYDQGTRKLHFSNCGHFPGLLLRSDGTLEKLTTKGMALGVERFENIETRTVTLERGDTLLLFTDGVIEGHNEKMEMFGEERLIESFQSKKALKAQAIVNELIQDVTLFAKNTSQYDDLTLLVIKSE